VERLRELIPSQHDADDIPFWVPTESAPTSVSEAYTVFRTELIRLSKKLRTKSGTGAAARHFTHFEDEVSKIEKRFIIEFTNTTTVTNSTLTGSPVGNSQLNVDDAVVADARRTNAQALIDEFATAFNAMTEIRPALVTVDSFDLVAGHELGRWFATLFRSLTNTLVVVTRAPAARAPDVPPEHVLRRKLEFFTREEIGELLRAYLAAETVDEELVDVVAEWSDGHPFTAAIAGKLLRRTRERDPQAFRRELDALPADEEGRADLALAIVPDPLEDVVRAVSVARRFDTLLLEALADPLPAPSENVISELKKEGLIEEIGGTGSGDHRLHTFIRVPLEKALEPAPRRELHRRAADHYHAEVSKEEEELPEGARGYDAWYRYEDPRWQSNVREWLYHQREGSEREGSEGDEGRRLARLRFARVFLDAFWWWGCYVYFPFCDDLLADWEQANDDDTEWLVDLRTVLQTYPDGYQKQGRPGWEDVAAALDQVLLATELEVPAKKLRTDEERHVRALIENFLAHAARYREPARAGKQLYDDAVRHYEEAARLFEQNEDEWELAWTCFELAELHVEQRQSEKARPLWQRAVELELAAEDVDEELRANLHRLVADARWNDDDRPGALRAHGNAVLHAYLFHVRSKQKRPDAYTRAFYIEQMERAVERLLDLAPADAPAAVARVREPFGAADGVTDADVARLVAARDGDGLAAALFPPAPTVDELLEARSPFTRRWMQIRRALPGDPDTDLTTVEP
jgi:hypothetical protein